MDDASWLIDRLPGIHRYGVTPFRRAAPDENPLEAAFNQLEQAMDRWCDRAQLAS